MKNNITPIVPSSSKRGRSGGMVPEMNGTENSRTDPGLPDSWGKMGAVGRDVTRSEKSLKVREGQKHFRPEPCIPYKSRLPAIQKKRTQNDPKRHLPGRSRLCYHPGMGSGNSIPGRRKPSPGRSGRPGEGDSSTPRWMRARRRENDFTDSERKRR